MTSWVIIFIGFAVYAVLIALVAYRLGHRNGRRSMSLEVLVAAPKPPQMDLSNTVARDPRRG